LIEGHAERYIERPPKQACFHYSTWILRSAAAAAAAPDDLPQRDYHSV
jgi:hypothetical protein